MCVLVDLLPPCCQLPHATTTGDRRQWWIFFPLLPAAARTTTGDRGAASWPSEPKTPRTYKATVIRRRIQKEIRNFQQELILLSMMAGGIRCADPIKRLPLPLWKWRVGGCLLLVTCVKCCGWQVATLCREVECSWRLCVSV